MSGCVKTGAPAPSPERRYTVNAQAGWGLAIWRDMAEELHSGRELAWRLFLRDISVRYRQSVFGVLWALLLPLLAMGTFLALSSARVLQVGGTDVAYPVFLVWGLTCWQLFSGGLSACTNALVAGGSMVVKINFPKETLVLAALGQALVDFAVRLVILAAVCLLTGTAPHWAALLAPLVLLPLLLLTLGLGFALSLVNMVFRDTGPTVTVLTTLLLFVTPVAYPAPSAGTLAILMRLNPLSHLIGAARDLVFSGRIADPGGLAWASGLSVAVFLVAWRAFHLAEYKMAEVL